MYSLPQCSRSIICIGTDPIPDPTLLFNDIEDSKKTVFKKFFLYSITYPRYMLILYINFQG
jgi:hypothetical protein